MEKVLIANAGSASRKYALWSGEEELAKSHFEKEDGGFVAGIEFRGNHEKTKISEEEYGNSLGYFLKFLGAMKIAEAGEIKKAGLRVVAPGEYFAQNRLIDGEFKLRLAEARERAPLHIAPALAELASIEKNFERVPVWAVSDSAFHSSMPEISKRYSLPEEVASRLGIYRYGYHGISVKSALRKTEKMFGELPHRIIVCHLGGGSSITAVKYGKSFDTTMGFTPLEGLPMGTRVGDIDPGALVYMMEKENYNPKQLEEFLNAKCGLLGFSGKSADIRELIELEKSGDKNAAFALEAFAYQIKKRIGSYMAALDGLDLLVFTATIGERSFIMRNKICSELENLGIILDQKKNEAVVSRDGFIEDQKSGVKIVVITADEAGEMAKELMEAKR